MEIRLFGSVEATVDGHPVVLGTREQRAVLAMLALRTNAPVSTDRLIEGLWGDQPPPSAQQKVQLYVSQLRELLEGDGAEILTRDRGYELRLPEDSVDALRFERLVATAGRRERTSNGAAREALSLWRGPPLADLADEPFAAAEIRRLEELWLRARELAVGSPDEESPEAPSNEAQSVTATFLFADIEGSTRLLGEIGRGAYGQVLIDFYRLMRAAVTEMNGRQVGTQGDSLFIVFRSAADAVAAAAAAQRSLAAHSWPAGTQMRVRMGIHTGEATLAAGDYFGLAVHRAARICGAAHGGQVLVSELAEEDLPARLSRATSVYGG
jgi:class 3 adenylate cyclase